MVAPLIPATQKAKVGELLEPGRQRLQWAKITPLYCSLGDRVRLHFKKEKNLKKEMEGERYMKTSCSTTSTFMLIQNGFT